MRSGGEVAGDRAVRTAAVAALLLLLMLAVWASVLAAADHAWLRAHYDAPRIITVANCFAMGAPVTVLGVLLVTRSAGRRLGAVLVAAAMGCFLPTIVWDLFAAGDMSPADTVLCVTVASLGLACRAPMVLLLPLWLVPARTRPVRWARSGLTLVVAGYFLGYGLLWALALPRLGSVSNPLWHTPLGHWAAIPFYDRYAVVEEYVVQAMTAVGTTALALVAVRTPDSGRRLLLLLAALYPLCAHLLLSDFWGPGLRTVAALLTGSVLWLAVIGVSIAGTDVWRLDRATRHRIAQACVAMVLAVAVTGTFAVTWAADPAVGDGETLAAAACSLALGWILRPAAHRATTWVERAFYGPRARPHDAARALAARLQQAPYPHEVPEQICRSAVEDVGVSGAAVSVDTRAGPRLLASAGTPPTSPAQTFPLRYHGQTVGRLDITSDGSAAPPERERALLALLADQAGPALAALRLTEEAQAARERLVLTREEERRRLRREIHDGLGPLLASVRLRIDTAQARYPGSDPGAAQLRLAQDGLEEALLEVRRITAGLTPAALVERGLSAAVQDLARRLGHPGLDVVVDTGPGQLPALPPGVETAAYRISAEALTNAVRHSGARCVRIVLTAERDVMTVTVTDNGTGPGTDAHPGTGVASMTERAEEIGGNCTFTTTPGSTVVHARLPLAPPTNKEQHR